MSEMDFEAQVHLIAAQMEYPSTPDLAGSVAARLRSSTRPRLLSKAAAWSLTIALILISSLMLIPPARAAIIEFIQVGIIRIFPPAVESTAQPIRTPMPIETASVVPATSVPTSDLLPTLKRIAGKTTLANAQNRVDYPLLLPTYPADLGEPDLVYVQNAEGDMTILVWLDPQQPGQVLLSLHFIPSGSWAITKMGPRVIRETQVDGQYAVWAEGPYPLRVLSSEEIEFTRLIDGHVLIWENDGVTYRVETDLSMEEAIKIAESLEPIQ